jgi:hypothetical protein
LKPLIRLPKTAGSASAQALVKQRLIYNLENAPTRQLQDALAELVRKEDV